MAKNSSKKSTNKRPSATPKAGVTRSNNGRRYGCGGKLAKSK